jgi:hypothetical protein
MDPVYEARRLQEQTRNAIPRRSDGSGVSWIYCKNATAEHFGFDKLPSPKDQGFPLPGSNYVFSYPPTKLGGANNLSLRIAYAWTPGRIKPDMVRVRLGGNPVMETVQVLTNILNESGRDWLWICNHHGNKLSRSAFHSAAV